MRTACILARFDAFSSVPPDALGELSSASRERVFRASEKLVRQGEVGAPLFLVVEGRVRIERQHPDLTEPVALGECGPGELVGGLRARDGAGAANAVVAVGDTVAVELDRVILAALIERYDLDLTSWEYFGGYLSLCPAEPEELGEVGRFPLGEVS